VEEENRARVVEDVALTVNVPENLAPRDLVLLRAGVADQLSADTNRARAHAKSRARARANLVHLRAPALRDAVAPTEERKDLNVAERLRDVNANLDLVNVNLGRVKLEKLKNALMV
jgi:hypothetical protein